MLVRQRPQFYGKNEFMKNAFLPLLLALSAVPAFAVTPWTESGDGADFSVRRGALTPMVSVGAVGETKLGGQLDFMNTVSNFSLALRAAKAANFVQYGASLRGYLPVWTLTDVRFYAGLGPTFLGSRGDSSAAVRRPFWDLAISPVLRVLYAPIDAVGLMAEVGWDGRLMRTYTDKARHPELAHTEPGFKSSLYFGLGLSIAVN